jgi:hypothetical protein
VIACFADFDILSLYISITFPGNKVNQQTSPYPLVHLYTRSLFDSSNEFCNGIGMKELGSCNHFCP